MQHGIACRKAAWHRLAWHGLAASMRHERGAAQQRWAWTEPCNALSRAHHGSSGCIKAWYVHGMACSGMA